MIAQPGRGPPGELSKEIVWQHGEPLIFKDGKDCILPQGGLGCQAAQQPQGTPASGNIVPLRVAGKRAAYGASSLIDTAIARKSSAIMILDKTT